MRSLWLILLLCGSSFAQYGGDKSELIPASGGATPGLVNETSFNSTLTNHVGTNPTGQTACAAYSLCLPFPEPALAGNLGIVTGHFANSTTLTPTVVDDKSDSGTCITGSAKDSGTNEWPFACYIPNLTVGSHYFTVTFGTTQVTQVEGKVSQFYNIATSSPTDGTPCGFTGSSSTSGTGCAITTTQSNSLVYALFCRAGTPATDKFTAGSGFTLLTEDINDGCTSEYEIKSSPGSVTPAMTLATSSGSTYVGFVIAFKSATAGTAPSGWYADRLMSWSSAYNLAGQTFDFQFTSTGNFLLNTNSCGDMTPGTAPSDGVNTWTFSGDTVTTSVILGESYVAGASANSTGLISVTTTGSSGDCTFNFYDFTNAPATPIVTRNPTINYTGSTAATLLIQADAAHSPDGVSTGWNWLNDPSTGLVVGVGGQGFNTTLGVNEPSTGLVADAGYYGGMNLSGPGGTTNPLLSQNNPYFHGYTTTGAQPWFVVNESSATTATSVWAVDTIGVFGSGAGIVHATEGESTSTPLTLTVPSTTAGNLGAIACTWYNSTARTMTSMCFDGTTCATANKFTAVPSSTAAGTSGRNATAVWDSLSLPAGKTTLTVTTSGTVTHLECEYAEVQKATGTWAIDNSGSGAATSGGTGSGTTINGPAITTSGTVDFCLAINGLAGGPTTQAPKTGNEYTYENVIFNGDTNAAIALLTTSASAHTPSWVETTSGDNFNASQACWK